MRRWAVLSASVAPFALIGGWTVAAGRQPPSYNSVRDTISALAEHGASDRWIMTVGLALLGSCHLATAAGLTEAAAAGRVLLAVGGGATVAVALLPQPSGGHIPAATVGFIALALWPAASTVPSRRSAVLATTVLLALLVWLFVELGGGALTGLSERLLAGAQALWPIGVVCLIFGRERVRRSSGSAARR